MQELGVVPDRPQDGSAQEVGRGLGDLVDGLPVLLSRALRQMELQFAAVLQRFVDPSRFLDVGFRATTSWDIDA